MSKHPRYNHETDKDDWIAYVNSKAGTKRCNGKMLDVEIVKRKNMYHFHEKDEEYLKIIMQFPSDVTTYRDYLHTVILSLSIVMNSMVQMMLSLKTIVLFKKQNS